MKRIFCISFFLFLLTEISYSEVSDPGYEVMSPQVASFTRYGNYPVSYYTGNPNITIPLYEVNEQGFKFPIYLQYDASGLLPNKDAGIVGQNWTLVAGGMITRQVRGIPDDIVYDYNSVTIPDTELYGYWYGIRTLGSPLSFSALKTNIPNLFTIPSNFTAEDAEGVHLELSAAYEHEPDLFTVNALGETFNFMIDNTGQVKVFGNRPCKVDLSGLTIQSSNSTFQSTPSTIVVTMDNGYKYYFGGSLPNLEITYPTEKMIPQGSSQCPNCGQSPYYSVFISRGVVNSWYLTKVVTPNNRTITFTQMSHGEIVWAGDANYMQKNISRISGKKTNNGMISCFSAYFGKGIWYQTVDYGFSLTKLAYLKTINTQLSTINFYYSLSNHSPYGKLTDYVSQDATIFQSGYYLKNYQLDSISIVSKSDTSCTKRIRFDYTTYANNDFSMTESGIGKGSTRRFLSSVTIDKNQKHTFEYYQTDKLVSPLVPTIDMQGYYNDGSGTSLIAPCDDPFVTTVSGRAADPTYASLGLIKRITYPTGGYTDFEYESHNYNTRIIRKTDGTIGEETEIGSGYSGYIGYLGGARIKSIKHSSGEIINYIYTDSLGRSTGIYKTSPIRTVSYTSTYSGQPFYYCSSTVSASNMYECSTIPESCIGYSQVTETRSGGISNGRTVYYFSNYATNPDVYTLGSGSYTVPTNYVTSGENYFKAQMNHLMTYSSKALDRGLLLKKEDYDAVGNLVCKDTNYYDISSTKEVNAVLGAHVGFAGCGHGVLNAYATYCYTNNLIRKQTYTYSPTGAIVEDIHYSYDGQNRTDFAHNFMTSESKLLSNGDTMVTEYKRPLDYMWMYVNNGGTSLGLYELRAKNIQTPVIEQMSYVKKAGESAKRLLESTITLYTLQDSMVLPKYVYKTHLQEPLSNYVPSSLGSPNFSFIYQTDLFTKELSYDLYDSYSGRLLQYTDKTGVPVALLWGYNREYPVAKVVNANYANIANSWGGSNGYSFIASESVLPVLTETYAQQLNNLRTTSSYEVTTYTYSPLKGVTSITDPRGVSTYYDYDSNWRLKESYMMINGTKKSLQWYDYKYHNEY